MRVELEFALTKEEGRWWSIRCRNIPGLISQGEGLPHVNTMIDELVHIVETDAGYASQYGKGSGPRGAKTIVRQATLPEYQPLAS
jgi:predicted RNase H-like HicB family nuclease